MFLKGMECPEVRAKAMMNLGLVYQKKAEQNAASGNLESAKDFASNASNLLDAAKPPFDELLASGSSDIDDEKYAAQYTPLRLQAHRILGSVYAGLKDFPSCE